MDQKVKRVVFYMNYSVREEVFDKEVEKFSSFTIHKLIYLGKIGIKMKMINKKQLKQYLKHQFKSKDSFSLKIYMFKKRSLFIDYL